MFILLSIFFFMVMATSAVYGFGWFFIGFAWIFKIIFWIFFFGLIASVILAVANRGKSQPNQKV